VNDNFIDFLKQRKNWTWPEGYQIYLVDSYEIELRLEYEDTLIATYGEDVQFDKVNADVYHDFLSVLNAGHGITIGDELYVSVDRLLYDRTSDSKEPISNRENLIQSIIAYKDAQHLISKYRSEKTYEWERVPAFITLLNNTASFQDANAVYGVLHPLWHKVKRNTVWETRNFPPFNRQLLFDPIDGNLVEVDYLIRPSEKSAIEDGQSNVVAFADETEIAFYDYPITPANLNYIFWNWWAKEVLIDNKPIRVADTNITITKRKELGSGVWYEVKTSDKTYVKQLPELGSLMAQLNIKPHQAPFVY